MEKLKLLLFYLCDLIIPKKNIICFSSFTDFSDNPYALFLYMLKSEELKEFRFVWLISESEKLESYKKLHSEKRVKIVDKDSIYGLWLYFKSRYVFFSHGLYKNVKSYNGKKRVNLWHGMPFKKVGNLDENFNGTLPSQDKLIVTSELCSNIYSKAFLIDSKDIEILGQPRNDFFFNEESTLKKIDTNLLKYSKIIAWLPTYRVSNIGDVRKDTEDSNNYLDFLSLEDLKYINEILIRDNLALIVKLHPMDVFNKESIAGLSNIFIYNNSDLFEAKVQLYSFLGECNALITDYSSVFIDFLLLDKPIGFTVSDFLDYKKSRGFLFDNPEEMMPGDFIYNKEDFVLFLENIFKGNDEYFEKRKIVSNKYNLYKDNNSSKRITNWILKK